MMTGFRLNLSPLKEPLGFIKLVEWVSHVPKDREVWSPPLDFLFMVIKLEL